MIKRRSIGCISYNSYVSHQEIVFTRRSKTGQPQVRRSIPTRAQLMALINRVNMCLMRREGFVFVYSTGWSFFPDNVPYVS